MSTMESPWNPTKKKKGCLQVLKWKSTLLYQLWACFQKKAFSALQPSYNFYQGRRNDWTGRTVQWAGFRVHIDLCSVTSWHRLRLWEPLKTSQACFPQSVFYPRKKKTTLYRSSVKSHFFSWPCGSQTEPQHAFPMKRKSAVSKLRATSRQIKALITATKLEGGEWLPALDTRPPPVVLTPHNSRQQNTQVHLGSSCVESVHVLIMQNEIFTGL